MKLIIDIPDYDYIHIKEVYEKNDIVESTYSYIYYGTPLDDIKAEMEKQIERDLIYSESEIFKVPCHLGTANGLQVAIRIINNMCKTESEGEE